MVDLTKNFLELRKALQIFLATLDADTNAADMLEVPSAFPAFKVGKAYKAKEVFRYGENSVGDAQLYMVLQDHVSSDVWMPYNTASLYKAIGVTAEGYPEWVQPLGASDAYNKGDQVRHTEKIWTSDVDANVWEPGVYGWTESVAR
jgi:hypothetical protein